MPDFDKIEDTLFVPMLGRIYCSEHFPHILKDDKALELKAKLPKDIKGQDTQTQYTLMASAVRSTNMDRYIKDFLTRHADGVVVLLGAGLETTFYRNDTGKNVWYEVDLPAVIEYRRELLGETDRDRCIAGSAMEEDWIKRVREENPDAPILAVASGVFMYFSHDDVTGICNMLRKYGDVEMVFDIFNSTGMKQVHRLMKQVGHADAEMFFYIDKIDEFKAEIGCKEATSEKFYTLVPRKGMKFTTRVSMTVCDWCNMVKMIHLTLN